MVTAKEIDRQLKNIGVTFWFLGNAELRELRHILVDGEVIEHCVLGRYEGGFAVLCATSYRLLLIDKKPFYLTLEDVRYDMIVEVDFAHRLLNATIKVRTPSKTLTFTSHKNHEIRQLVTYIQHRILADRQQQTPPPQQYGMSQQLQPQQQLQYNQLQYQAKPAWQPERFIGQAAAPLPTPQHSVKNIALTAFDGASRVADTVPIANMRQAINPYARSSFTMKQRISRF